MTEWHMIMRCMWHLRFKRRRKLRFCSTRISSNVTAGTAVRGLAVANSGRPQFTRTDWVVTDWQTDSMAQAVGWTAESRIARQEIACLEAVAYPGILFGGGGSTNSVEDRGQRERGSGGGSPLVSGSGGSCNLVQEISFHIVKFS